MGEVGLILLAAGSSTRLGQPKQLVRFRGRPLIRSVAQQMLDSTCDRILVVLGAHAEVIAVELAGLPVRTVENPEWNLGMGTSIRAGLAEMERLSPAIEAVVIAVCDQPLLTAAVVDRLVSTYRSTGSRIVGSRYAGMLGVPALFAREKFGELRALDPAEGARSLLRKHAGDVAVIDFPGGAVDVDTVEDLDRLYAM